MLKIKWLSVLFFLALITASCQTHYVAKSIEFKDYRIARDKKTDAKINSMIQPYADSVHKSMNDVIGIAAITMDKKEPESLLGNLMADIMLSKAKELYVTNVDAAIMNYGGIRLPAIPEGNITKGKIFELSPFDNIIVLQVLDGRILQALMDHIASKNGWPVAGINMQIKNKKAYNVTVNGQPIDINKKYTIALLDYVANGGDDASMLRGIPQINHGFLYRDAILDFINVATKSGNKISSKIEKRVSYAE